MASGDPVQEAGGESGGIALAAWKLPPIVAAIALSIVTGFYLGGPGLGMAVGALAAASIVVMAVRHPPLHPIVPASASDARSHLLVVLAAPLEDPGAIDEIAALADSGSGADEAEIVVLAAARHRFLDRWTSDLEPGRRRAQRALVICLASLAGAGLDAGARVGDEDLVQAVDDQLRSYPAAAVVLVSGPTGGAHPTAARLRARLRAPLVEIEQARPKPAPQRVADRFAKAR